MPFTWAELRDYTRLRRRPVVRASASGRTAEFDAHKVFKLPNEPETAKERSRGAPPIKRIAELQGGRCFLCGKPMVTPTRDHVKPRASGGTNHRNILAAHTRCNNEKANRLPFVCETLYAVILYDMIDNPYPIRQGVRA